MLTTERQCEMYRRIQRIRQFEESLIIRGTEGHLAIGQEAAIVGACMALNDNDYITGTHRSHGHPIGKGAALRPLMAEMLGKVTGICKGRGGSMHFADSTVGVISESAIVGGGIPLATGAALSITVLATDQVSLCFFGDGACNEGAFSEAINMAAIWNLPVIYFCENNHYAMTTSITQSHGQPDIAKRAEAFGVPGISVDGQNADAVYQVTAEAVSRARDGNGPTLIEAKTYRFEEHNEGLEVPTPYRSEAEINHYRTHCDPLVLYRDHLLKEGISEHQLLAITVEVATEVADAIKFADDSPFPDESSLYDYMYSNPINYPN